MTTVNRIAAAIAGMAMWLAPTLTYADAGAIGVRITGTGRWNYTMCNAQASTGDCTSSGGDEIVATVSSFSAITFYATQSTASAFTCNIMSNDVGHDAASGAGQQVNVTSLTKTEQVITLYGTLNKVWVTCPSITDAAVTVTMIGYDPAR